MTSKNFPASICPVNMLLLNLSVVSLSLLELYRQLIEVQDALGHEQ